MPKPLRGEFTAEQLIEIIDLIRVDFAKAVVRSYEILWPGWPDSAPPGRIGLTIPDAQHTQIREARPETAAGWDQLGPKAASSVPDPPDEPVEEPAVFQAGRAMSGAPDELAAAIMRSVVPADPPRTGR